MNYILLLINEIRLQYYELRQYWFETVSGVALMMGLFVGLFYGVKSMMPGAEDDASLDGLLFGFILWSFAATAYQSVTKSVIDDTQKGYSEQLFMCHVGFSGLMLLRAIAELIIGYFWLVLTAVGAMWLTGNWIDIDYLMLFALLTLAAPSLIGLGFLISGLALLFKKVETLGAMLSIAFMGLVALDGLPLNIFTLLPFVPGASLARDVIVERQPLEWLHIAIVAANSLAYITVGLIAFKKFEHQAKKRNLIGRY